MNITNFQKERVRIGQEYPACLDVELTECGTMATFHHFEGAEDELARAELRHKGGAYALFLFRYDDEVLPEWWMDSKIVWELKPKEVSNGQS
jgi:hypothetical protein